MNLFEQDNLIYVPPKLPLLNPQTSEGLEILGTFCRRLSKIQLELKLINRNNVNLTDFAIQLNKNSFGLSLDQNSSSLFPQYLSPYQSVDITFDLNFGGLQGPSEPINSVQLAFKTNLGVFFTQATFSLHILFNEDGMLDQGDFLNLWPQYGAIGEYTIQIDNINNIGTVKLLREKLHKNNVFTIADRFIDNKVINLYTIQQLVIN
jgi:hypothetical protein